MPPEDRSKPDHQALSKKDTLLARVLADPADDALRQVWADALQEAGDPRGELIAINIASIGRALTTAEDKRVRSILAKHATEWLGLLEPVVMHKAGLMFDRGVISSCQIQVKKLPALAKAVGHPLWSTVRSLWFCDKFAWDARIVPLLVHPILKELRVITGIGMNNVFPALATHEEPLPVTQIYTYDDTWRAMDSGILRIPRVGKAPSLPKLTDFGAHVSAQEWQWIFGLPLLKRLERFVLTVYAPLQESLDLAERLESLPVFELRPDWIIQQGKYRSFTSFRFERDAKGRFSRLTVKVGGFVGPYAPMLDLPQPPVKHVPRKGDRYEMVSRSLDRHLESIAENAFERVELRVPEDARIKRALRRFSRADITFVPPTS